MFQGENVSATPLALPNNWYKMLQIEYMDHNSLHDDMVRHGRTLRMNKCTLIGGTLCFLCILPSSICAEHAKWGGASDVVQWTVKI